MELNEKVTNALNCCKWDDVSLCKLCPYYNPSNSNCISEMSKDAIMLVDGLIEDIQAKDKTITGLLKTISDMSDVKNEYEIFIGGLKSKIEEIKNQVRLETLEQMKKSMPQKESGDE